MGGTYLTPLEARTGLEPQYIVLRQETQINANQRFCLLKRQKTRVLLRTTCKK